MPAAKRRREASDDDDARELASPHSGAGDDGLSQTVYAMTKR